MTIDAKKFIAIRKTEIFFKKCSFDSLTIKDGVSGTKGNSNIPGINILTVHLSHTLEECP